MARSALADIFLRFLSLGLRSFGGPVAHLGYFRREFVERAAWLSDEQYGELVALCSALPGPTSSQVGISLGALRGGPAGALLAWTGFTAPSAIAMAALGIALRAGAALHATPAYARGLLAGLGTAAAAVVFLAVVTMAQSLARSSATRAIALASFVLALVLASYSAALQWVPLVFGALAGWAAIRDVAIPNAPLQTRVPRSLATVAAAVLAAGILIVPWLGAGVPGLALFGTFFRAGSLVFGGGHVVLPFLQGTIEHGLVSSRNFYAGYGAAQAMPGPLFTFASFLGAVNLSPASGAFGALIATAGIFAPSFALLICAFAIWQPLRALPRAGAVLAGVNAAVVGLLGAVFAGPIAHTVLIKPPAVVLATLAFIALAFFKAPAWAVVGGCGLIGALAAGAGLFLT